MLYKKYQFPLNIFIVFEKLNPVIYTSKSLTPNHYVCYITNKWYYGINIFLKKELLINSNFLTDMSAIDTLNFEKNIFNVEIFNNKNRFIVYNTYYLYLCKIRLSIFQNINKNIQSIDSIYPNASWLERETFEMYNIQFLNKKDNRSLLLDYSRNEFPMLKDFPTEGFYEIYFDFFENKVNYIKNEFIEL